MKKGVCCFSSPVGKIGIEENNGNIIGIFYVKDCNIQEIPPETMLLKEALKQFDEYFSGIRKVFDLPIEMNGTDFQKRVWKALMKIPYGETRSYSEIAEAVGNKKACRAVGAANRKNPLLIVVPCHRVIGKNGSLTGFSCGIDVKEKLLKWEKIIGKA